MAFSCRPSLIVLDEPTTGLDVSTQRHVLETVKQLCVTYGVAAVYVSHDLVVVRNLVSEIAVMYAGRIVEQGRTEVVFDSPAHPYTPGATWQRSPPLSAPRSSSASAGNRPGRVIAPGMLVRKPLCFSYRSVRGGTSAGTCPDRCRGAVRAGKRDPERPRRITRADACGRSGAARGVARGSQHVGALR